MRGSPRNLALIFSLTLFLALALIPLHADDEAIAKAAGGIQPRKETHVSMQRERLSIGLDKVTVDFWFLNESDKDVTTEVGFPVPPYQWNSGEPGDVPDFSDFKVWVNGRDVKYQTDVRARLNGKDYTNLLRRLGLPVDFAPYGAKGEVDPQEPISRLSSTQRTQLLRLGLIQPQPGYTYNYDYDYAWYDYRTYYWSQVFPAHQVVHIRHEYKPIVGYRGFEPDKFGKAMDGACISPEVEQKLLAISKPSLSTKRRAPSDTLLYAYWVKYILTSANTWKTPIKDFELIVETPDAGAQASHLGPGVQAPYLASFCWNGRVQRLDKNHFVARRRNFVPNHELTVYFLLDY